MSTLSLACERVRAVSPLSLVVAVLVGFAMSGCASFAQTAPPVTATCHSAQQCRVPVEVTCSQSPCTISVPSQFGNVDANGFDVVWEIVPKEGQSYTFNNPGGIFFKKSEGQQAFMCHPEANGKRFSCHGNRNGNAYEYGIELVGSPPVAKLDPWIVNR